MSAWKRSAVALGGLLLAGCAETGGRLDAPEAPAADAALLDGLFGVWQSTVGAAPPDSAVDPAVVDAFEGLNVEITERYVIGLVGNRCDDPSFRDAGAVPVGGIPPGGVTAAALALDSDQATEIAIACAGFVFDSLYLVDADTLLSSTGDAVYRLTRLEAAPGGTENGSTATLLDGPMSDGPMPDGPMIVGAVPAFAEPIGPAGPEAEPPVLARDRALPRTSDRQAVATAAPVAEPVAEPIDAAGGPEVPTPPATARRTVAQAPTDGVAEGAWPRPAAHLASYRQPANAAEGWRVLSARFPALGAMTPVLTEFQHPQQGRFVRLSAVGGPDGGIPALCRSIAAAGQYCGVITIAAGDRPTALAGGDLAPVPSAVAATPAPADPVPAEPTDPTPAEPATPIEAPPPPARPEEAPQTADAGGSTSPADPPAAAAAEEGPVDPAAVEAAPGEDPPPALTLTPTAPEPPTPADDAAASETGEETEMAAAPTQPPAAPEETAAAAVAAGLTADYLIGTWGFEDPQQACESGDFIAFFPEGTASLYDEFEGTWQIDGNTVRLALVSASAAESGDRRNIALDMQVDDLGDDQFRATFVSAGESAGMTAYRCPGR